MSSWMLTGIIAAQSTDIQYIILFSNISNREIKDAPDQLIQWLKLRQMSDESYWCMHVSLDFLHLQEAVQGLCFLPHHVLLPRKVKVHVVNFRQASGRGNNDESLGTKQFSSITHPLVSGWGKCRCGKLTCHQTGISLWERPLWKKEHFWYLEVFLLTCPLQTWLTAIRRCCKQLLNLISGRKWFYPLNGTVTKNRTLAEPPCQVRRLSNLKPACIIYLYPFVCSATRRMPSFVEDWLCHAHGCTFF